MQIDALNKQRQYVYNNLDPATIAPQVTKADVARANNRLALQGQIDPALLTSRYAAEAQQAAQLGQFGPGSESAQVGSAATHEALAGTPGLEQAKDQLVSQAMDELKSGATLPPDVQAELVKAGLEQSGMTTGAASPKGVGGQILRTILGTAGIQLKQQRQNQAQQLLTTAQNLDTARQNVLQNLFPRLAQTQLSNLGATQSVANQSQNFLPDVGPTGTDVANLWLARVGATNQLAQQAANVGAQQQTALGQVWGNALGGATGTIGGMLPNTASAWNSLFSPSVGAGGGGQITGGADWSNPANYGMV